MLNRPAINRRLRAEAEHKKSTAGETPLVLPDMPDLSMEQMAEKAPAKPRKRPAKRKAAKK
jgi:hypothetical protein